jgi:hypothetical protein
MFGGAGAGGKRKSGGGGGGGAYSAKELAGLKAGAYTHPLSGSN